MTQQARLCNLLRIDHAIIQAPIGSATTAQLAAAVSNAGALGTLSLSWRTLQETRQILKQTSALTRRPYGVNLVLTADQSERLSISLDAGIRIIWTFWGRPNRYVSQVHSAGALLMHSAGSLPEALDAAEAGVDVLVLQGVEAGGHVRGSEPAIDLLHQVKEQISDVPLVLAGGLAARSDVQTAAAAGADGVCLGTRFVCASEANAAPLYQQAIIDAGEGGTLLSELFDKGWPNARHRVIRNTTTAMWEAAGCPSSGQRPGEHQQVATTAAGLPVERYSDVIPTADMQGDLEALALYAGESSVGIHDVLPAAEIIRQLSGQLL